MRWKCRLAPVAPSKLTQHETITPFVGAKPQIPPHPFRNGAGYVQCIPPPHQKRLASLLRLLACGGCTNE